MVRIPEEYQEVEYIESSKRTYINTNIIPNDNMRIYLEGITKEEINTAGFFFGSRTRKSTPIPNKFWGLTWNNEYKYGFMEDTNIKITDAKKNQHFIFDFNFNQNHDMRINNIIVTPQTTTENSYTYPIFLFGINSGGSLDSQQQSFIIKKFVIYNNYQDAQPSLYFIPCYRKSDGEIGMYDTVSKQFFTNSGTGTFLKGHNVYYDDVNLLEQRRKILLNTPHLETVQNNIVTFNTDMNVSLKDCKIYFSPIQEGEGDPSPDNVRPIRGWDGINVYIGRNILNGMTLNYRNGTIIYPYNYGSETVYAKTGSACTNWIDCSQYRGQTLTLNHAPEPGSAGWCFYSATNTSDYVTGFYSKDDSSVVEGGLWTITVPDGDNINYMRFSTHPDYLDDVQILLNMETTTISFPQTIYGGYVDLIKGEIVKTYQKYSFTGDQPLTKQNYVLKPFVYVFNGNTLKNIAFTRSYDINLSVCNKLKIETDRFHYVHDGCISITNSSVYVYLLFNGSNIFGETAEEAKTKLKEWYDNNEPLEIASKLKQGFETIYSINPQTLKTLKGTNNIFSNANGNIQVKFWSHLNNAYQHIPAETLTTTDDFIIATNDNYIIGDENNYIIY